MDHDLLAPTRAQAEREARQPYPEATPEQVAEIKAVFDEAFPGEPELVF